MGDDHVRTRVGFSGGKPSSLPERSEVRRSSVDVHDHGPSPAQDHPEHQAQDGPAGEKLQHDPHRLAPGKLRPMPITPSHRPLFVGTLDTLSGRITYRLIYACGNDPFPGDFVTTNPPDVTCETCRAAILPTWPSDHMLLSPRSVETRPAP